MLLNWVVVVMTHHPADSDRQNWSQRSVIPVHNRDDAERIADAIQNTFTNICVLSAEVCVQIPAQKGKVLLTVWAVEELIKEWSEASHQT